MTYWVSTPRFTVVVEVDTAGVIRVTAPYLRRTWQGKPWARLQASLQRQWGTQALFRHLDDRLEE